MVLEERPGETIEALAGTDQNQSGEETEDACKKRTEDESGIIFQVCACSFQEVMFSQVRRESIYRIRVNLAECWPVRKTGPNPSHIAHVTASI